MPTDHESLGGGEDWHVSTLTCSLSCRSHFNKRIICNLYSFDFFVFSYNFRSLGVPAIRALNMSRGSREGNNAFTKVLPAVPLHYISQLSHETSN